MTVQDFLLNPHPSAAEAKEIFSNIAAGEYSPVIIAALLSTIRTRGVTPEDIAGAAEAFLEAATPIDIQQRPIIDCVGTGGDGAHTINISTAASLVAAAGGITVVKHGNRSISSRSGAADVLEALGFNLGTSPEEAAQHAAEHNFTFLSAPAYHPAFKHVMPVRKELIIPTIFNILGPLINPARPELQLMGINDPAIGPIIADALIQLGRKRALVVHGSGTDEIAVHGPTQVWEINEGTISSYTINPEDLGLHTYALEDLRGGDGKENASLLSDVFAGHGKEAHGAAIAATAGGLFYLSNRADSLSDGVQQAQELIASGAVQQWLQGLSL